MHEGQFNEKEQQATGDFCSTRELRGAARVAQQEYIPAGCSKSPDFSPARPWRAKTRLVPGKAAADEGTGGFFSSLIESRYSSGLMIFGGRGGNERCSVGRVSEVHQLRIMVTKLITIAPPAAGQNPVTENPLTR